MEGSAPSRKEVWKMFDRIAPTYDLLNRCLSLRQDVAWRNKVAKYLPQRDDQHILDIATGTGDMLFSMLNKSKKIHSAVGVDMSEKMLEFGRQKIKNRKLQDKMQLLLGDATQLEFADNTFDCTSISFGIRNVVDVEKALSEMNRVLKPGGRSLILEFSLPKNRVMRSLYLFYFRHILPRIGSLFSGDGYAYSYLNQTVESFPYGQEFCKLMENAGFRDVKSVPLTFAIATIYYGDK